MEKKTLTALYLNSGYSMRQIARLEDVSEHKVQYWMDKHHIHRRTIGEAPSMRKHGPNGGFKIKANLSPYETVLYGLGVGLYWGEGNKRNRNAVRLGNTDPGIIATFINFLVVVCGVNRDSIRYSLQIFSDTSEERALSYWLSKLHIHKNQIMPTVNRIISGKMGTYKVKNRYGVLTVYVFNTRLRDWLVDQLHVPR
ncbi:hypothetical protein LRY29_01235 [Candidatus Saccharibacteria bacterium]|nr:hypothetical protein [Candidatus Saccharibacteria bacterium]